MKYAGDSGLKWKVIQNIVSWLECTYNEICRRFLSLMLKLYMYSKISLLRPLKIKTTSLFRPVFASPKWHFPYDIVFDNKTTPLIRPLLGSPKGGFNIGILLYLLPMPILDNF